MAKAAAGKMDVFQGGKQGGMVFNVRDAEEDQGFVAVPAGLYDCRVLDVTFKHSASKGNPMWEVVLETVEKVEGRNARFWYYVVWTQEQLGRAKKFLMRVAPEIVESQDATEFNPSEAKWINKVIAKKCRARVTVETYENENRNRVKDVLPPGEAQDFF